MQYRTLDQIVADAEVHPARELTRAERLRRWADLLAEEPWRRLRAVPDVEYGPVAERAARRIDNSPLSLAYADPVLRGAGLAGDRIGDAIDFFGLSYGQMHRLVCVCTNGRLITAATLADRLQRLARRAESPVLSVGTGVALGAAALAAGAAAAMALF